MNIVKIFLIDHDAAYCNALGASLINLANNFSLTIGDSKKPFHDLQDFDLVICGEQEKSAVLDQVPENKIIYLSESPTGNQNTSLEISQQQSDTGKQRIQKISKYQPTSDMIQDIKYYLGKGNGSKNEVVADTNTKIVGFIGASGGCGQTSLVITLSRILSFYFEKRVFYLNGESIDSSPFYIPEATARNRSMTDFIYYLFQKRKGEEWVEGFTYEDNYHVHGFYSSQMINEFTHLSSKETETLINLLGGKGQYDVILIDISPVINDTTVAVLRLCDGIALVQKPDLISVRKNEQLLRFMREELQKDQHLHVWEVMNQSIEREIPALQNEFVLPNDPDSFQAGNNTNEIQLNRKYGIAAHQLAESIATWLEESM